MNGDGVPCLLSKQVGSGSLVYFTNWPLSFVWDNPVDRPIIEYGMNSLMATELKLSLARDAAVELSLARVLGGATLQTLAAAS